MAKITHCVTLIVTKDCSDPSPMTPTQLKSWLNAQFKGCDYGTVEVREITTNEDGNEIDNKYWINIKD